MSSSFSDYQVVCVCGGFGFPLGTASASRITNVGKTLLAAGMRFRLLHCGPSPVAVNTERTGIYQGIPFEYTSSVKRPSNTLVRLLLYCRAAVGLALRLAKLRSSRKNTAIYLYAMEGLLSLYLAVVCRMLGLRIVQEVCEWWPGDPDCSAITRWLYKGPMFRFASGALVISSAIEERVRERRSAVNPRLLIFRLPAIVDADRFASAQCTADGVIPTFVYCGTWLRDVLFLIQTLGAARGKGYHFHLKIVGLCCEQRDLILQCAIENGLTDGDIILAGCVDEADLQSCYKEAAALLLPLPDDDRSRTRLPNKLGEYLASGRPVVTCKIGDLTHFLVDNVSAYLAEPSSEQDFAAKLISVLQNPARATQVGAAGQNAARMHLDYQRYVSDLAAFFVACITRRPQGNFDAPGEIRGGYSRLRNVSCSLLALGVIASGRVRRARTRAQSGFVTAIYFHNPNRRLLERCIAWLKKHHYTFISTHELIEIIRRGATPPKGAVWLSFDDGFESLLDNVLPCVRTRKIPVTFFVPSGIIKGDGLLPWLHQGHVPDTGLRDTMNGQQLKEVAACAEVTIGSHTVSHIVTPGLSEERAQFEFGESKRELEASTGSAVKSFAYPEGKLDGRERAWLEHFGYELAATTKTALIDSTTDPYLVPRFNVGDNIWMPEAICNMTGVWRPVIEPVIARLRRSAKLAELLWSSKPPGNIPQPGTR